MNPNASVSLDMDNLWSYLKTHGDPTWQSRPSYLEALVPRMLEVFDAHSITATVFVVGADAAREDGQKAVAAINEAGHEVGNHSYEHEPWLHTYERGRLEEELARTEDAIVGAGAPRPRGFRGPGYSLSPELLELLDDRGYTYDASTLPTWIGPLARAYYFRSSHLAEEDKQQRSALFGSASEGLRPVHPYRWVQPGLQQPPRRAAGHDRAAAARAVARLLPVAPAPVLAACRPRVLRDRAAVVQLPRRRTVAAAAPARPA